MFYTDIHSENKTKKSLPVKKTQIMDTVAKWLPCRGQQASIDWQVSWQEQ